MYLAFIIRYDKVYFKLLSSSKGCEMKTGKIKCFYDIEFRLLLRRIRLIQNVIISNYRSWKGQKRGKTVCILCTKAAMCSSKPHETGTLNEYEARNRKCMQGFFKSLKSNCFDMYFFCLVGTWLLRVIVTL